MTPYLSATWPLRVAAAKDSEFVLYSSVRPARMHSLALLGRSVSCAGVSLLPCLVLFFSLQPVVMAQGPPGAISFAQSNFSVNESGGNASITLTRTGGTSGRVVGKVGLTDATTSPADYVFKPGSPDLTFPTHQLSFFFHGPQAIALQPDGKIILAPSRVRLNPDGSVDSTFNAPVFNSPGYSAAVQADGKIVFIGGFTTVGGVRKNGIARLNSDGSLDTSFDVGGGTSDANVIAFQADGKILIGGIFDRFNNDTTLSNLVRLNTDGSLDTSFAKGTSVSSTYALAVQPNGKILMGGWGLARLNTDGSVDNSFNCQLGAVVGVLVLQPDGKILAGGGFDHFGSQSVYNIARINTDGSLDTTFNTGSGPDTGVSAIVVQPDGKVVIGGSFDSINGTFRSKIARLNSDGSVDSTFAGIGSVSGTRVEALLMQGNGKLVGSGFFSFTTTPLNYIVLGRFNGDIFATWNDGDSADKTINLPIVDDSLQESNETLNLTLTPLSGGATGGAITNATLTITDNDVAPAFTSGLPPQGITRLNYSHTFTATGTPNPIFSLTSGTLPPGLFLQSSGLLSGQPNAAGTFSNITVTASNGVAPAATQTFNITILSGGTLQFSSSAYNVGEPDGSATITVTRTGGTAGATSVAYSANFGSATAGSDFTATSGSLNFADGETSKTFAVPVINDILDESNETVSMFVGSVSGSGALGSPSSATLTIADDDPPPSISITDVTLTEGNSGIKLAVFNVTLSSASGLVITVNFGTANGTTTAPGAGSDYTPTSSSLTFAPGTVLRTVSVSIVGDSFFEPTETFFVNLSNPVNGSLTDAQGVGTIQNDDPFQLIMDQSGAAPDQAIAIDSILFLRGPFPVLSYATWFDMGSDRNTRVLVFSNVLLNSGQDPANIVVRLVASDGQVYEIGAEAVSRIFGTPLSQIRFRLPDGIAAASCLIMLRAHSQNSNVGSFRIAP